VVIIDLDEKRKELSKKVGKLYKDFGYPDLIKITTIRKMRSDCISKKGESNWIGKYNPRNKQFEFESITITIPFNLREKSENIVLLHEVTHIIHRLELKKEDYNSKDYHNKQFYEIGKQIDSKFEDNDGKNIYHKWFQ
jgi:hypothetical protein